MKRIYFIITIISFFIIPACNKDFLNKQPLGALSEEVLATPAGVDGLLVGAYSALRGVNLGSSTPWSASPTNWIFGSVAGGDAHKGSDAGDQAPINPIATWSVTPANPMVADKWIVMYAGIDRVNAVFKVLPKVTSLTDAEVKNIGGQAHFLRGHYYFELKRFYDNVPWIDENTVDFKQKNDQDIWPKIEEDFKYAWENLPETQSDAGRVNKWAAGAYLAKVYMYQHKYPEAKTLFDQVIASGKTSRGIKYNLFAQYEDNFRPEKELESPEAVFSVEMAANVGTGTINQATQGEMLNYPYGESPFGCCGFYQPSIELANSFRTDVNGLPLLDGAYNNSANAVKNDMGILSTQSFTPDNGNLDPRIDWTIGRRGIPYLDWGLHPGQSWIRDQNFSGPYAPKKNVWWNATEQYHDNNSWAPATAINTLIIRFADVLLMAAEANAQTNNLGVALTLVNRVRARAANPAGWVYKYNNNSQPLNGFSNVPAANYRVSPYPSLPTKEYALKAIYFERKLELAMEGHRYFDLVRWGIAADAMNAYYAYEGNIVNDVKGSKFTANKNERYPIPQSEIDKTMVNGQKTLTQNPGYQ